MDRQRNRRASAAQVIAAGTVRVIDLGLVSKERDHGTCNHSGQPGPGDGLEHVLRDSLAADIGFCPLWHHPGGGFPSGDGKGTGWRLAEKPHPGDALWDCLQFVLVCRRGAGPLDFPERSQLCFGHGL